MLATYHNHTTWSDGKSTLREHIDFAARHGIAELGISDHYVLHPSGDEPRWAMKRGQLPQYVQEILAARQGAAERGVALRLGLEVDYFPGQAEAMIAAFDPWSFDYLIGSVHEIEGFVIDGSPAAWERIDTAQINEVHRRYWVNIRGLATSGLVDVIAHIDLPKKFGYYPTRPPAEEIDAALDAIAESGLVVELNTAGWHKPCADAYPTPDILAACRARGIETTLSADAHHSEHLVRDFDRGAERLVEAGYNRVARFRERSRRFDSIDAAIAPAAR